MMSIVLNLTIIFALPHLKQITYTVYKLSIDKYKIFRLLTVVGNKNNDLYDIYPAHSHARLAFQR